MYATKALVQTPVTTTPPTIDGSDSVRLATARGMFRESSSKSYKISTASGEIGGRTVGHVFLIDHQPSKKGGLWLILSVVAVKTSRSF